ncbi:MAG TPA: hypothetical protein VK943_04735, partial [Arenibaculum sp.]|nr:hypothetical protein [Arenibaculum sp.]
MTRSIPVPLLALALALLSHPSSAQDAGACADEVQRLADAFTLMEADGEPLAQEPGARRGASLGDDQRQRVEDLIQEARAAGQRGDAQGCIQRLAEARTQLREAGLGGSGAGVVSGGETTGGQTQ